MRRLIVRRSRRQEPISNPFRTSRKMYQLGRNAAFSTTSSDRVAPTSAQFKNTYRVALKPGSDKFGSDLTVTSLPRSPLPLACRTSLGSGVVVHRHYSPSAAILDNTRRSTASDLGRTRSPPYRDHPAAARRGRGRYRGRRTNNALRSISTSRSRGDSVRYAQPDRCDPSA
jgi:hypothetical protein